MTKPLSPQEQGDSEKKESTLPKQEGALPKQEGAFTKSEGTFSKKEGYSPKKDGYFPKKEGAFPKKEGYFPKRQGAFRKKEGYFPKKEGFQKRGFPTPKQPKNIPPEVQKLMDEEKLSLFGAFKVHQKEMTLEQAKAEDKRRNERREQANLITKKFKTISFAVACHILKEGITPEEYLQRKAANFGKKRELLFKRKDKMEKDEKQHPALQLLNQYCQNKTELELAQYDGTLLSGTIKDFTPYEFLFATEARDMIIHRLKIKYFYPKEQAAAVQKWVMIDKTIQKNKTKPAFKPTDRYQFVEGVLQNDAEIMLALQEGEMIRGKIVWFTPYDILLKASKSDIWVFRHAVLECALVKRPGAN